MAVLSISHSTRDDALATGLVAWLKANGFNDIFIDHESIAGGEKWRDALRASASSCRVVIPLVTPNWLASAECFGEFVAAWYMGKRLIPLRASLNGCGLAAGTCPHLGRPRAEGVTRACA
jgi:hypothetical protein